MLDVDGRSLGHELRTVVTVVGCTKHLFAMIRIYVKRFKGGRHGQMSREDSMQVAYVRDEGPSQEC